jgi:protein TonB
MAIPRLSRESIGVSSPAAKPPTGAGATDDIDRSGQVAYAPEPVERVVPEYPSAARSRGIEGQVILRAIVDPDGHIEDSIEVVRAVPALDQAAIAALRQWLFRPARDRNGRPLRVRIEVPVVFVLR